MGKGDKRSKRGKIFAASYGKYRKKRKTGGKIQKPKAVETKQ